MKDQRPFKILLFLLILLVIGSFYFFGGDQYLSLDYIQQKLTELRTYGDKHPLLLAGIFCTVYILITGFSIPGSLVLTLLSGAIFGVGIGTALVVTSGTLGATMAFLMARYLFRDFISQKFKRHYLKINKKLKDDGKSYLLIMRMIPVSPFVVVNNVMGLSSMKIGTYFWITYAGMLPGTFIYVFAGRKISEIESASQILSWPVILSLSLLALFPIITKKLLQVHRRKGDWREA